jgi:hypothetical protein
MNKPSVLKATFQDLIKKKLQKEQAATAFRDINVSSMNRVLTFKKPSDDMILDVMEEIGDKKDVKKMMEVFRKLIYQCCPMLQDIELHKQLEIIDPFDVVKILFDLSDIMEIGEQLMDFINLNGKAEEIKNS